MVEIDKNEDRTKEVTQFTHLDIANIRPYLNSEVSHVNGGILTSPRDYSPPPKMPSSKAITIRKLVSHYLVFVLSEETHTL